MSARVERRDGRAAAVVIAAAVAVLVARPFAAGTADARTVIFTASYVLIGLASLALPLRSDRPTIAPGAVLLVGLAAVGIAGVAGGTPVPVPWSAAALPLSLLAAVAEEALFRRAAFGRLERFGPFVAVVGSALLFGLVHLPAYGLTAMPVDVGAGLLFGWQRWASGTWTVSAATHAAANAWAVLR
jgi:membrane protease YdiL (CAAX protease family)